MQGGILSIFCVENPGYDSLLFIAMDQSPCGEILFMFRQLVFSVSDILVATEIKMSESSLA